MGGGDVPPPEIDTFLAVSGSRKAPMADDSNLSEFSDHALEEKIQRLMSLISSGFANRLADRGDKLRINLRELQSERNRRKLVVSSKGVGACCSLSQLTNSNPSGTVAHYHADTTTSEPFSQSSSEKLEDQAVVACSKGTKIASQDKGKVSKKCELKTCGRGHQIAVSSSQPPNVSRQQTPSLSARNSSEKDLRFSNSDSRIFKSCSLSCNRRKTCSGNQRLIDSGGGNSMARMFKVREVVMLDEEVHSAHPTGCDTGKWKKRKIYYPSRDDPESVELSIADIQCLDPESYLSSPIMNFYIQYLQRPESAVNRPGGDYHFFSTYFYKKLGEAVSYRADKACFAKLRRWWKGVNIFEKSYIFVPVHGNLHWSLVVICIPAKEDESGPVVLHLDSLGIHNSCSIFDVIDRYLIEEWNCMNQNSCLDLPISEEIWRHLPQNISNKKITVPQQKNEYDCGLFVLYFMEKFIEEAPDRLRKNDLTMFGSEWFRPEDASGMRKRLQDLLLEVFRCSAAVEEDTAESTSSGSSLADD
ncbi:ubiquitin-like-specific protease 1D isoform X1 [Zingiber officinale]|uniref:Ubiquitin-like protease family profile domain-containing protein n=1 Tax=Zingiber officinale TaxID=94328 RepID=A0A8J5LQH7_ZINOF|nr:ubiquitin-like-specific protease 1D isoform X1 [Zingiber officinale]KAG6534115.1 hypothetical protein ZIOFF_007999 [Zingiber officinale]